MKKIALVLVLAALSLASKAQNRSFGSDSIDVISYTIFVDTIDIGTKTIYGCTDVYLQPKINNLQYVPLDLLSLIVDSVYIDGTKVTNLNYNDTLLMIECPTPLPDSDTAIVKVYYHGQPVMDPSTWGGFYFTTPYAYNLGVGFEAEPHNFGRVWFPCIDDFVDKAYYDMYISTDTTQMAVCGGTLVDSTHLAGGRIVWHWALNEPIPTYLASMAVGPYVCAADTFLGINGSIPINIYVAQTLIPNISGTFGNLKPVLTTFESRFGPYLWERVGYVGVPFNAGAMEHATNIAYPNATITGNTTYEYLYAHELSHHWFGDLVTCSTAEEMWLNEGWAVFCEFIYKESIYGQDAMQVYIKNKLADVIKRAHFDDGGFYPVGNVPSNITYGTTVYDKGGLVVHTLRNYMGDSLFFPAVKEYLDSLKYGNSNIATMRDIFSASSGIDLTDFFNAWVYREGFPHFDVDSMTIVPNGPNSDITVYLRQKLFGTSQYANSNRVELTFVDPLREMYSVTAEFSGQTGTGMFTIPFVPSTVLVDMNEKTADAVIGYNQLIGTTGTNSFPLAYNYVEITNFTDTILLRTEFHKVAPDPIVSNPDIYRISPNHYWRIGGIFPEGTTFTVQFDYNRTASGSTGYLDTELMSTATSADSLILVYRQGPGFDWEITPFTRAGNFTVGKIKATNGLPGEYALAIGKPFQSGLPESKADGFKISPNPSSDFFLIELNNNQGGIITIISQSGTVVYSNKINKSTKSIEWNPNGVAPGNYIVLQTADNGSKVSSATITLSTK
ncbi:MAG: hypothetical protein CVU11_01465 [Bacteroidetes bacterium HGW-Bacteroidetes-6]|jgi:aminopeptidase N|nr:MAG: hypothetical protein CVU11_01465 [Bacteroidetes bacterium HGW-Bacteroidetes-6]